MEKECEFCGGAGFVFHDVFDPDSGHYMMGVGESACVCKTGRKCQEYDEMLSEKVIRDIPCKNEK
jgi:hypothetical protein